MTGVGMNAKKGGKTFREQADWMLGNIGNLPEKPFCDECERDTVAIRTGKLVTINFIGKTWGLGKSNKCPVCGSVERNMWFIMLLPILPLGRWKVKYLARNKFVTRKMMKSSFPDFARQHDTSRRNPMLMPLLLILLIVIVVGMGGVILLNPVQH
jgi:hypothetical protein